MSLRRRLTVVLLVLSAVGMIAAATITYRAMRGFLIDRLDEQSTALRTAAIAQLTGGQLPPAMPGAGLSSQPSVYTAVVDARGRVVRASWSTEATEAQAPDLTGFTGDLPARTVTNAAGQEFRTYGTAISGEQTLVVAVSLADLQATLGRLLVLETVVSGVILILLGGLTLVVVRQGLRPLERMARTSAAIAAGDLTRRVDRADERTEVGQLGGALNVMLARIEEAFAQRAVSEERLRNFVADASHELRTPLTSISGYAEMFHRGAAADPQDLAVIMRRIHEESSRMTRMVEDLLLLARLDENRPLQTADVDLVRVCREVATDATAAAPDRPIFVYGPAHLVVRGDTDRLRQVVTNIVRNACVHTPAATPIEILLRHDNPYSSVCVEVVDHGGGIPDNLKQRVFDRFHRNAGHRSPSTGGAGLGMAIVAAIVAAHGGTVTIRDTLGGGATVAVTLPGERVTRKVDSVPVDHGVLFLGKEQ
ncbi:sensor histidine kinase [Amycolatopsis sp. NPDC004378]